MKTIIMYGIMCIVFSSVLNAQSTLDKVNDGLYKADQAQGTFNKLKGLLPKKKSKQTDQTSLQNSSQTPPVTNLNSTIILIQNIDFSKLKSFNEDIKACQGVDSTSFKFASDQSIITVFHSGTTEQLLKLMEETSKDIFTENNISSFQQGSINIKL